MQIAAGDKQGAVKVAHYPQFQTVFQDRTAQCSEGCIAVVHQGAVDQKGFVHCIQCADYTGQLECVVVIFPINTRCHHHSLAIQVAADFDNVAHFQLVGSHVVVIKSVGGEQDGLAKCYQDAGFQVDAGNWANQLGLAFKFARFTAFAIGVDCAGDAHYLAYFQVGLNQCFAIHIDIGAAHIVVHAVNNHAAKPGHHALGNFSFSRCRSATTAVIGGGCAATTAAATAGSKQ